MIRFFWVVAVWLLLLFGGGGLVAAVETPSLPASYVVWWPGKSSDNTPESVAAEMERMTKVYHPQYILIWSSWIDYEPEPNRFDFKVLDMIMGEARKRNIKAIIEISADFYGGIGYLPYTYASADSPLSWFWKKKVQKSDGSWEETGLYDPLTEGMRYPPTCGCNCPGGVNEAYGNDVCMLMRLSNDFTAATCDGVETIAGGKVIKVNEHPDLVYNPFDTCWPGNASGNLNIHTPYPSFSSKAYRKELLELWRAVATHVKQNYADNVWGFQVWHEPSYAHYRNATAKPNMPSKTYEVDYSQPELEEFNKWLAQKGKPARVDIPQPPDEDYVYFRKYNLANLQRLMKDEIKSVIPGVMVGTNLFMAALNNEGEARRIGVDAKVLYEIMKPDFISEATLVAENWDERHYGDVSSDQIFWGIKEINKDGVPLLTTSIDVGKEVGMFGSKFMTAIEGHAVKQSDGSKMPLIAAWASPRYEREWNSPNTAIGGRLASAYPKNYGQKITKLEIPETMKIGEKYTIEAVTANLGRSTWDGNNKSNPFGVGVRWYNADGKEVDGEGEPVGTGGDYKPLNFRSYLPEGGKVWPGEQEVFKVVVSPPGKAGGYKMKVDVIQEGVAWFESYGSEALMAEVEVTGGGEVGKGIPGDANGDQSVDLADLGIWKDEFANKSGLRSDFDGSMEVGFGDLAVWKSAYVGENTLTPTLIPVLQTCNRCSVFYDNQRTEWQAYDCNASPTTTTAVKRIYDTECKAPRSTKRNNVCQRCSKSANGQYVWWELESGKTCENDPSSSALVMKTEVGALAMCQW